MSDKAVILKSVSKKYPIMKAQHKDVNLQDFWALRDVNADIESGQVMGIIGRNGAGKTTLLNIIAGVLSPTEGEVSVSGKVMGLFNLGVGFQDELSGRENIFLNSAILGADRKEIESKLDSIIEFSELGNFINMPLGSYSQGMRLRLGFSIIANLDFDIFVIDEVLAVGDSLFQSKCYERLMDFKRQGRTLVITSQDMGIIERLCDEVVVLDHGRLIFKGNPAESINKYRALLNTEKFFVGPAALKDEEFIENTKKWVDDKSDWGKKLGTKEVTIDCVRFLNRFGFRANTTSTRQYLKIKVSFTVKNRIKEPHFGVAIFREDGVYCYGPNTGFEGYDIQELKPGKGYFTLKYKRLLLAPGNYRVSVAIWDKNEALAYNYHEGYYKLTVVGYSNINNELLNMPFRIRHTKSTLEKTNTEGITLLNSLGQERDRFMTNEPVRFCISRGSDKDISRGSHSGLDIYRDDGIYCQGIPVPLKKDSSFDVFFQKLYLLPGSYDISIRVLDNSQQKILIRHKNISSFRMVFNKHDHGTAYLEHEWNWRLP